MSFPDVVNLISVISLIVAAAIIWWINPLERWKVHGYLLGIMFIGLAILHMIADFVAPATSSRAGFSLVENLVTLAVLVVGVMILLRNHSSIEAHRRQVTHEQECKLANLVNNLPDVFVRFDRNLRFVLVNDTVEKEFGVKPSDLTGNTLYDINLPKENLEQIREIIQSVLETGHPRMDEIGLVMPEGKRYYISYGLPELSQGNHVETALFTMRNITDKVRADQAIRESEERFSRVVRANPMGMHFYRLDPDDRLVLLDYNQSADTILKITHAELLGQSIEEAFPGLVATEIPSAYRRLAREGGQWHWEQVMYNEGIISGAYEVDAFQINPMHMVATFTDITARKLQEEAIQLGEERMKLAVQTSGLRVWEMEVASGKTNWLNDMYPLFGRDPQKDQQTAEEYFQEIILPEDLAKIEALYEEMKLKSLTVTPPDEKYLMVDTPYTYRARRQDNSEVVILGSMAFQRDSAGNFTRIVGTIIDITQQKKAEQMIQQQVEELELLRTIDQAIISTNDVHSCIKELIAPIQRFFSADAVEVLLYSPESESIHFIAGDGYISKFIIPTFPVKQGTPWLAISSREMVYLKNIPDNPGLCSNTFYKEEKIVSCYTIPLMTPNRVQGVLQVFYRQETALDDSRTEFLSAVAGQLAIAVEKSLLWDSLQATLSDLREAYETSLETLVHALDLRDNETEHHTRRVTELSIATALALGVPPEQVDNIRRGALLHDVGKIGIPDSILYKAGSLSEAEWSIMRQHPIKAYNLLRKIELFHDALDIPYSHHERWDGSGYPLGLKGEAIPLAARIFALADVWDALTSDRPYRKRWTDEQAVAHISANAGVLFDPNVTEIFLSLVKKA